MSSLPTTLEDYDVGTVEGSYFKFFPFPSSSVETIINVHDAFSAAQEAIARDSALIICIFICDTLSYQPLMTTLWNDSTTNNKVIPTCRPRVAEAEVKLHTLSIKKVREQKLFVLPYRLQLFLTALDEKLRIRDRSFVIQTAVPAATMIGWFRLRSYEHKRWHPTASCLRDSCQYCDQTWYTITPLCTEAVPLLLAYNGLNDFVSGGTANRVLLVPGDTLMLPCHACFRLIPAEKTTSIFISVCTTGTHLNRDISDSELSWDFELIQTSSENVPTTAGAFVASSAWKSQLYRNCHFLEKSDGGFCCSEKTVHRYELHTAPAMHFNRVGIPPGVERLTMMGDTSNKEDARPEQGNNSKPAIDGSIDNGCISTNKVQVDSNEDITTDDFNSATKEDEVVPETSRGIIRRGKRLRRAPSIYTPSKHENKKRVV